MAYAPIKLSAKTTHEFWEIPVLFEDEHLLAIDKPALLLTSPDRYDPDRPNLMRLLHDGIAQKKPWAESRGLTYLSNAHRLDFETTGVLLLAKSKPVLIALADQFNSERPQKHYLALVQGETPRQKITVNAAIAPHPTRLGRMRVDTKKGKQSRTEFTVAERFRGYTLFHCKPFTGRTHQLRVHLQYLKLPIVGDSVYGGDLLLLSRLKKRYVVKDGNVERPLISSVALHAEGLSLQHPVTHQRVDIHAPCPKDLQVALKYLRRYAAISDTPAPVEEVVPSGIIPFVLPPRDPSMITPGQGAAAGSGESLESEVEIEASAEEGSGDEPGED